MNGPPLLRTQILDAGRRPKEREDEDDEVTDSDHDIIPVAMVDKSIPVPPMHRYRSAMNL